MSKGPRIKPWVKSYIRVEALKNRAEPRDSVAQKIEDYLADKEAVPSRDTLNKKISEVRNSKDPLDRPWSRISLAKHEYHIPADALPTVMKIWARSIKQNRPLTIRQALWVARLRYVFNEKSKDWLGSLLDAAVASAYHEKALYLEEDGYPETREGILWHWLEDGFLYDQLGDSIGIINQLQNEMDKQYQAREAKKEGKSNER